MMVAICFHEALVSLYESTQRHSPKEQSRDVAGLRTSDVTQLSDLLLFCEFLSWSDEMNSIDEKYICWIS
jgi:hypothetical protein